ncbi:hypothetical protein HNP55_003222 [Paucibacter oligotrophus]|uniref:Uncharacterized protein n=1 Tax=Roseateles oligotrophus TaxID=1769250 RepID=A0A840LEQ5_9BURK|nr:hypothetical protein [Roseateles oligotrophus]MBB4844678.1 hypothetical protein [Roseateles oligotrophus]
MFFVSPEVRQKLKVKHGVTEVQIMQCFANREGRYLIDDREEHKTNPVTRWFIAQTDYGIILKVCFVYDPATKIIDIKTAFRPSQQAIDLYNKKAF